MPHIHACSTLGWAAFDRAEAMRAAKEMGYAHVEIAELGAYCHHLTPFDVDLSQVTRDLDAAGLSLIAINASTATTVDGAIVRLNLADRADQQTYAAKVRWFLDAAHQLRAPLLTVSTSVRMLDDRHWHAAAASLAECLLPLADHAANHGITLCMEMPHLFQLQDCVERSLAILASVDHPAIGVTLDSSHWGVIGYDVDAFIRELGSRLKHIHLRDSAGADTKDFRQTLEMTPGVGVVDFARLADSLDTAGYSGKCTLELEHRGDDQPHIAAQFRAAARHLSHLGWTLPDNVKLD